MKPLYEIEGPYTRGKFIREWLWKERFKIFDALLSLLLCVLAVVMAWLIFLELMPEPNCIRHGMVEHCFRKWGF